MGKFTDLCYNLVVGKNYSPIDLATLLIEYDTLTNFEKFEAIKGLKFLAEQQIWKEELSCNQMYQFNLIRKALMDYAK